MSEQLTIGLDLGGTNTEGVVLTRGNETVIRRSMATEASGGAAHVISRLAGLVEELISAGGLDKSQIAGVGIGAPGPMSFERGVILHAPNLPGWKDVALRDELRKATSLPVVLENDANAAAFGEFVAGAGESVRDMVMLTLGTGIGGGIIIDGKLLRGRYDNAGEIGHVIVERDGRPCPCGQRGCLERYASARAIAELATEAIRSSERSPLREKISRGETIDAADVDQAAQGGDPTAMRIWDQACRRLAIAGVMIQHMINPERIVLAGGLIGAGERLLGPVREYFQNLTWKSAADGPHFALATLGGQAGAVGAAALAVTSRER
ncbi:MAG: ROK family protein [Planctomycetes bacterium]|nr:ROK family protein [Planctomycetota bacterium]